MKLNSHEKSFIKKSIGVIAASVFATELLIMQILDFFGHAHGIFFSLFDAVILALVVSPIVFYFVVKPSAKHYAAELKLTARIQHRALHDELTALPRRELFMEQLKKEIEYSKRRDSAFSLVLIELRGLDVVATNLGPDVREQAIRQASRQLIRAVRRHDYIARVDDNDFCMICRDIKTEGTSTIVQRINHELREPVRVDDIDLHIECVTGVVAFPLHGSDASVLVKNAYMARDTAKAENLPSMIFEETIRGDDLRRVKLLGEIKHALSEDEIQVYLQPKKQLSDGRIVAVECLARWQHPTMGMLGPGEYITLLEKTELIKPFTLKTLKQAIEWQKRFSEQNQPLHFAVNFSVRLLSDSRFIDQVVQLFDHLGADPRQFIIEITETLNIYDSLRARFFIKYLAEKHFQVSIDDFGTGYSSMSYLTRLPFDELKIDQSFVMKMTTDAKSRKIVENVIALGHALDLRIVAEGVEDAATEDLLRELNCDIVQGYLIGHPVAPETLLKQIQAGEFNPVS